MVVPGMCCVCVVMGVGVWGGRAGVFCVVSNCVVCMMLLLLFGVFSSEHLFFLSCVSLVFPLRFFLFDGGVIFHSPFSPSDDGCLK